MVTMITALAVASGALMLTGYVLYIIKSLAHEIEPNPLTWGMFSYGTVLLTWLEYVRGASLEMLILPVTCSTLGIVVAVISVWQVFQRRKMGKPDWEDIASFILDVILTVAYLGGWYLLVHGQITQDWYGIANIVLLGISNVGAIPAFLPILRRTHSEPHHERAWPWLVWSSSYVVLAVLTYLQVGHLNELIVYPALNAFLHGYVGLLALPHRRRRKMYEVF